MDDDGDVIMSGGGGGGSNDGDIDYDSLLQRHETGKAADEGEYSDVDPEFAAAERIAAVAATDDNDPRHKTLLELTQGPNRAAAQNEINHKVYMFLVLMDVIGLRLQNSSGGASPHIFNTEMRKFVEKHPQMNVKTPDGRNPPFYRDEGPPIIEDDMNV